MDATSSNRIDRSSSDDVRVGAELAVVYIGEAGLRVRRVSILAARGASGSAAQAEI